MKDKKHSFSDIEALKFHAGDKPGKIEITPTKPMATQRDLSLAYSPGVAAPVRAISENANAAYDYTAKGNLVAVITNGTAILGLGNLGPLASKPVMEGKAVLFKRFADVDAMDLEVGTEDIDEFVNCARFLGPTFGGINLEDIKAPECFIIEERLREAMEIPVFHDDQHGTAIITAAGLLNAMDLTGRDIKKVKVVVNGAGAAALACLSLIKSMGVPADHAIICDSKGVIYEGRTEGMNQWKSAHAVKTKARTLADAMKGADIFLGLSVKGAVTQEMVKSMAKQPIIFAMANPDPEITPDDALEVVPDAIMATGRSDYPNQVNNVLGFPYIFRGALDVRATTINEEMKIAAAKALARLAREDVPDEVAVAYGSERLQYGPKYIIPAPFDPRLISQIPSAVAEAAMDTGVAQQPILDMDKYKATLSARLNPTVASLQRIYDQLHSVSKRVVFAEGEEERVIRAALSFRNNGYGVPVLVGRDEHIHRTLDQMGLGQIDDFEIQNSRTSNTSEIYADRLYKRLQRDGYLRRDCFRMVNTDRNIFAASMVANGDADAMVTGLTRNYNAALGDILKVIDTKPNKVIFGMSIIIARGRTLFVADTTVNSDPPAAFLADVAIEAAAAVRRFGLEPRIAFLSYSNFGNPKGAKIKPITDAVKILDEQDLDFEYDGEMGPDIALNQDLLSHYPFCRLSGPANVLIMPGLHTANISSKLLQQLGKGHVIGPLLIGLEESAQIVPMGATASELVSMAALAAYDVNG